eukprot:2874083-Heterocapsa_arctica.AAC.1
MLAPCFAPAAERADPKGAVVGVPVEILHADGGASRSILLSAEGVRSCAGLGGGPRPSVECVRLACALVAPCDAALDFGGCAPCPPRGTGPAGLPFPDGCAPPGMELPFFLGSAGDGGGNAPTQKAADVEGSVEVA